ncbi:MAG TPA: hypothetical protein VGB59_00890 [Allosphingosinicella sp.]|jgi:hypothetical protein
MRLAVAAAALSLTLAGCVPMKEMRAGAERERLVSLARQFCEAERSADPYDSEALFVDSIRSSLEQLPGGEAGAELARLTSGDPAAGCEPGRTWYRGGSRMFVEVRAGNRVDRLDFWRGSWPSIFDIHYSPGRRIAGRPVKTLRQALMIAEQRAKMVPPPPEPPDPDCYPGNYRFAFLATDTQVYRQGATVKVTPTIDQAPFGTRDVPLKCVSDWAVTGPAALSPDRTSLTFAPDAAPGSAVRVSFKYADKPVLAEFKVVGKDETVLTGRYSQQALAGCQVQDPVRELEFTPGNGFSVTFMPFETYKDYWGTYSFDPATRRILLTVKGGNFTPPGLDLDGEAELSGGKLVLKDLYLGSRNGAPQRDCVYTF